MNSKPHKQEPKGFTVETFTEAFENNLYYTRGQAVQSASANDAYVALSQTVRDILIDRCQPVKV